MSVLFRFNKMRTLDISFQNCGIALTSTHPNLNECLRTTKGKCYMLTHRMVLFCEIGFFLWSLYINFYIYNFSLLILVFLQFIQLVYHDSCMFHFHFDSVLNSSLPIKFERRFSSPFNDAMANGECLSAVKWKCFVLCYMSENRSVPLR